MSLRVGLRSTENAMSLLVRQQRVGTSLVALRSTRLGLGSNSAGGILRWKTPSPSLRRTLTTGKSEGESVAKEASNASTKEADSTLKQMIARFLGPKEMPERGTMTWYREMVLICTVFAITGSSTMVLVRPAVSSGLGLKGSFKDGPWSFRICSLVVMTPIYATLLVAVGTAFGRHHYFRHFSVKMWSRFGIPPELIDKSFHETKKTFRKW